MPQSKINVVQAMFLLTLAVGITNHVIIVPLILQVSLRDSWISALIAIPPLILWTIILYFVMKLTKQQSLFEWFKSHYNAIVAWLIIVPLIALCVTIMFVTLRDTSSWTKVTYLPKTPYPITVSLYAICGLFAALAGLRTLAIAAGLLLPAVMAFGLFVMSVNFQFKDYSYLFPVFTHGYPPILHGTVYTLGGLVEFVMLLGIQHHLSKKVRLSSLLVLTLAVTGLVFGPIIAAIAIFGPQEAADQRYPAFEQWRMVLIGKFISHLDFLSIYQWTSGALVRLSLAFYLLFDLLKLSRNKWKGAWMLATAIALIIGVSSNKLSDSLFFHFLKQYYFPSVMAFFYGFPFLLLLLILIKRGRTV
ncbi:GerAB/ArcD/ProY family transporter [Cohnella cholangitidis]|uniref:GerAB/ArcD/ProY family transporter n=1 Tax=Cohnella cholangitidis TaxID=2598458 RepID=A0A7G5C5Z8_9BACL|nr:endospore germination permease [Cohnella cholangitidis]QMV44632.1 GerAB/ArcD/ProY family transporter [Cohnella cholangitidis]